MSDGLLPIAGSVPESLRFQYDVKSIANLAEFKTLRREWDELTSTARTSSFSLTYSYCEVAAARLMSAGGRVEVIRVYDAGRLCALWPVAIHRKGLLRVAKTLSCGTDEEYGGPLMRDETDHDVLMQAVRAATGIHADVLQVRFVRSDSALQGALEALPHSWLLPVIPQGLRDDVPGYTMDLRQYPRWEDFTATRSKSMLVDSRRHAKRLHAKGQVEMGWCRTAEDAEAILTWLFANKREWAKARGFHTPYLMHDEVRDFFIELARRIDLTAMPLVTFIRLDGVPVAASLNVVGSRYFEGLITTYDEALSDCSPGNLMHEFCMKWAHEKGCDFDLRPVFSTYKARWANHITRHSTHTLFLTLRGRMAEYGLLAGYAERIKGRLRDTLAERRRAAEKSARPDAS